MARCLALLILLTLPLPAGAQDAITRERVDAAPLETGFTPDPIRSTGEAGGERALRRLGAGCDGYVGARPDAVFDLVSDFSFLRIFATSAANVSLALRGSDGRWRCATERVGAAVMEQGAFAPGRLEVWVGAPEPGQSATYELAVTEFRSVGPSVGGVGGELDIGLVLDAEEGRFRGRRLRRGFLPDPREDEGTATGGLDVRSLGPECRGYVDSQPSHQLTLRNDFDYFRVQLGDARGVASLIVRTPGGRYLCSSPDERNASVDRDAWPEGEYLVWVGTRERTGSVPYHICYTEVRPAEGQVLCGADGIGRRVGGRARRDEGARRERRAAERDEAAGPSGAPRLEEDEPSEDD